MCGHEIKYNELGRYTSLWDYIITISEFISVINSLPDKFDPIEFDVVTLSHIDLIDPYGEDNLED